MSGEVLVRVAGLRVHFGQVRAVDGIDFEVRAGECLALVGESGSGKTVASRALLGLVPSAGEMTADVLEIGGEDARAFDERRWQRLRGRVVGLVAQDALVSLDPLRTIGREVAEVLEVQSRREGVRLSRAAVDQAVTDELSRVAMPRPDHRTRQYAHELSGGLRQRALIASATIGRPMLLIADEPTTALDVSVQAQVLDLLVQLKRDGMAILVISHDLALVGRIADRVAVMQSRPDRGNRAGRRGPRFTGPRYTRTLLDATPSVHARRERLSAGPSSISGRPVAVDREHVVVSVPPALSQSFRQPDGSRHSAVDDVSFDLASGETIGIVGESGSGKTTRGRIVLGLQRPDSGEVLLDGQPWSTLPERDAS